MGKNQIKVPDTVTLLASAARTGDANGSAVAGWRGVVGLILQLAVTAKSASAGDKLDVKVQTSFDNSNWLDIYHFTQIDGATSAGFYKIKYLQLDDAAVAGGIAEFDTSTALDAGAGRAIFGQYFRGVVDITDGGGAHSWTFALTCCPVLGAAEPGSD